MAKQVAKRVSIILPLVWCDRANRVTAIESRVARIKARVAELTGNMDNTRK